MRNPTFTPYGERGLLVQIGSGAPADSGSEARPDGLAEQVTAWTATLAAAHVPGVIDLVPAARSVLLLLDEHTTPEQVREVIAGLDPSASHVPEEGEVVQIRVSYDGPDLAEVGDLTGLSREDVVAAHCGQLWRVAFAGFAPGFAYLAGADTRLVVPRRASPRTSVPPGSVALAAGYCAVYPRASPGGWQLIGSTEESMWDLDQSPPSRLRPGQRVRFVPVDS